MTALQAIKYGIGGAGMVGAPLALLAAATMGVGL